MLIAFIASNNTWEAELESRFGRTTSFVILDTKTNALTLQSNAKNAELAHGAGIQTAQAILQSGATAMICISLGPKAFAALKEATLPIYYANMGDTIRSAYDDYNANTLERAEAPNH